MKWPIRKGCMSCGNKLISFREKFTRQCDNCAKEALEGFQKMSEGRVKDGLKQVWETRVGTSNKSEEEKHEEQKMVQSVLKNRVGRHRKSIEKQLRKKGLSEEEIQDGLKKFEKME